MSTFNEDDIHGITHVCINSVPPFKNLLKIEGNLREHIHRDITCLFSYNTLTDLGVLIPNPFGFKPNSPQIPKLTGQDIANIGSILQETLHQATDKKFYHVANWCLTEQINHIFDLFYLTSIWTMEPISPDKRFTYTDYKTITYEYGGKYKNVHGDGGSDDDVDTQSNRPYNIVGSGWSNDFNMKKSDKPHMSYNDRADEAKTIIDLVGTNMPYGYTCFKLPENETVDITHIMDLFCEDSDMFKLDKTKVIKHEHIKILLLDYALCVK